MREIRELKDDGFARTALVELDGSLWVHKRFRFRFFWGPVAAPLARAFMRHELATTRRLDGVAGVAGRARACGSDALLREWVDGVDLREWHAERRPIRDDFFDRLRLTLAGLHGRGVAYNDLAKLDNVLVTRAGHPVLIDYQVALCGYEGESPALRALSRFLIPFLLPRLQREDERQLCKLKARVRPDLASEAERARSLDRGGISRAHYAFRRVFHPAKRIFYPKGSQEVFRFSRRAREARE